MLRLLKIGGWEPHSGDLSEVRSRIEDLYALPRPRRALGNLARSLPRAMWPALSRWHGDGVWGRWFDNAPTDEADLTLGDWQVIDLAGAVEHEDWCEAALTLSCTGRSRLPYGILPRLLLAWVCSEAVRTQSRVLTLGASLSAFMRKLGIENYSGGPRGDHTRLRHQMDRLFKAAIVLEYDGPGESVRVGSLVTDRMHLWWNERRPDTPVLWDSTIELGEKFFKEIVRHPVPIDLNILKALKRSSLGVDLYLWLVYRTFMLKAPLRLSWSMLYQQFGADPSKVEHGRTVSNFRRRCVRELRKIQTAWPDLVCRLPHGALVLHPARPRILPGRTDAGAKDMSKRVHKGLYHALLSLDVSKGVSWTGARHSAGGG